MVKTKRTALEKIQEGKGRDISRIFFFYHFPPSSVTKIIYPKACKMRNNKESFVMPIIHNYLSEWKKAGWIDVIKIKIPIDKKKGKSYNINGLGYRLNLEPLYSFCKTKGIEFNEEERKFINFILGQEYIRKIIMREYLTDNIINALLKFYIKHFVMLYGELYLLKNSKGLFNSSYEKLLKKKELQIKKLSARKRGSDRKEIIDEMDKIYETFKDSKISSERMFRESAIHMISYKDNPQFVFNIDRKFMKALGILS